MTEHWHGAQWVLATWFVIMSFAPIVVRLACAECAKAKKWETWIAEEIGRWFSRWTMISVLAWGGFWS